MLRVNEDEKQLLEAFTGDLVAKRREGAGGVDNALAGLAPVLSGVGGNLGGVNQAFSDRSDRRESGVSQSVVRWISSRPPYPKT